MPTRPLPDRPAAPSSPRPTYHHGDLRAALLREAVAVVREGGPAALSLREVTRRAGVTVSAAYRHFADRAALVQAVTFHGRATCADRITARQDEVAAIRGSELLHAVGIGYVGFARAEPGLFEAAFLEPVDLELAQDPRAAGERGLTPYGLLVDALDRMAADGELPAGRRPLAEVPCWSAVHGLAMLVVRGPLRAAPGEAVDALAERVVRGAIVAVSQV